MKKLLKFVGLGLIVIAVILLLIIGYANGKRFLKRISYRNCPSYIFIGAEFTDAKVELPTIQEKINELKIGDVIIEPEGENKVLILIQNNEDLFETEHQAVAVLLKELGLQETEMRGSGIYQAKKCDYGNDLIKYIRSIPLGSTP